VSKSIAALALAAVMSICRPAEAGDLEFDLVSETKLGKQLTEAREACKANEQAGNIEGIAVGSPAMFHGINPKSSRWPDARAAYVRYAISTCVPRNIQDYVDLAASLYEKELSEAELKEVLKFYRTDAGRRFAAASSRLSTELNKKTYEESREGLKQGGIRFESDMQEIESELDSNLP
jgi:hypothetical protein